MDLNNKGIQWFVLIMLAFTWGSSFILMKLSLRDYDMYQVGALRILFSFLLMLPLTIKNLKKVNKDNILFLLIVGLIGNTLPAFLFTAAQTHIDSSLAGILNSLTPLFTLIIGVYLFKAKATWINVIGVIIAFIGAFGLMVKTDLQTFFGGANSYALFVILASACYGTSVNVVKNKLKEMDGLTITSLSFFITGPICGVILLFTDFTPAMESSAGLENLLYVFILALFSSVIALIFFNILIKYTTAIFASSVTYIIPIFAIIWGVIFGEEMRFEDILWAIIILIGIYLVNKKTKAKLA